jgi:hypothetical protein
VSALSRRRVGLSIHGRGGHSQQVCESAQRLGAEESVVRLLAFVRVRCPVLPQRLPAN